MHIANTPVYCFPRSIYRLIVRIIGPKLWSFRLNFRLVPQELSDGWRGVIITTQVYFSKSTLSVSSGVSLKGCPHLDVLDGAMIVLAMYTLNFFHPGRLIGRADAWLNSSSQATRTKVTEKDGV